jgi:glucose 1-dehydrogenase
MRLKDKIALVTGSSQGIGRAIAVRFAQEGADVVINYNRTAKGAEETLAEVEAAGRRGLIVQADLGKVEDIRRLINRGIAHFGRLGALVNNAGLETHAPFWDVTEADYDTARATSFCRTHQITWSRTSDCKRSCRT